jgi:hypothetical protein
LEQQQLSLRPRDFWTITAPISISGSFAAGIFCVAQCYDSFADLAAVGNGAAAISHHEQVAAVAVGYAGFAIAPDKGTAISIGSEAAAMAGQDG